MTNCVSIPHNVNIESDTSHNFDNFDKVRTVVQGDNSLLNTQMLSPSETVYLAITLGKSVLSVTSVTSVTSITLGFRMITGE